MDPHLSNPLAQSWRFCHQYLQLEQDLNYPEPAELREAETQEFLYNTLFADGALQYAPPRRYQLRVLKELVGKLEASIEDWEEHGVSDDLMSSLSQILATPLPDEPAATQQKCYVTYYLSALKQAATLHTHSVQLTLLESRSVISSSGTTGLRTWEAALHLGRYLCANQEVVSEKRILELGAGTGYLSILCAKFLGASHCIASDGSDDVINNLTDNFFLNGLQGSDRISPMDLKLGHALVGTEEDKWNGGRPVNVILGADITYDSSVVSALVGTLEELVSMFPEATIIISVTERNKTTFEIFKNASSRAGLIVEVVDFPAPAREQQPGPFYNDEFPIHICQLRKW